MLSGMNLEPDDVRLMPIQLRRELLASGYDDAAILRAVRSGEWVRARRGAYVNAAPFAALDDRSRHAVRARAAARQAKTDVVVSHTSAIALFPDPIPTWGLDLRNVHLTRRDGRSGRKEAGIQQHRGRLIDGDVIRLGDVDVTSPVRALLEVTTLATVEVGLVLASCLLHRKLVTMEQVVQRYAGTMDHWPQTLTTDLVLRLADGRIESVGEGRVLHLCFAQALPMPCLQYEVRDESGRVVARLDFAWPEYGVWVEFDGRIKYEELRREGESATDAVLREKRRQEMIEDLTGWRCIRLSWADLAHPERVAAKIRAAFARSAA
ncbi:putative AbiEi antitoxin of type IV toxin-antitoxin system [Nocardioides albertanoniae]|uniref:Putative AbiEi antitoxin of type IV toxin-antitoxin system n=1 Tax=Nocardioides albertanoniae TaxID=1175486 RepID=A0A543AA59_9ACTN|nr:type IV toxin-antitoxin system AbiEi family antitoxin domain-containing protein [Nocardioides albertanoniae]TQL69465.1 putative AbiEi antitoxin of type IV toxin-antitoxin system [Nocardioides albertanoniae]